jgi:hypothetical protein
MELSYVSSRPVTLYSDDLEGLVAADDPVGRSIRSWETNGELGARRKGATSVESQIRGKEDAGQYGWKRRKRVLCF